MENPTQVLETRNLCFSSCKNYKLKVNLLCVGARERKKRPFFAPFILPEEIFINICIFSQCITYWIHFQNIHAFTYQKTLLYTLFCLFLESSKAFSVSLIISPLSLHNFYIYLTVKTSYRFRKDFRNPGRKKEQNKPNLTVIFCLSYSAYVPNLLIILIFIFMRKSSFLPTGNFVFVKNGWEIVVGFKIVKLSDCIGSVSNKSYWNTYLSGGSSVNQLLHLKLNSVSPAVPFSGLRWYIASVICNRNQTLFIYIYI